VPETDCQWHVHISVAFSPTSTHTAVSVRPTVWVVQTHWSAGAGSKRIDTKPAYVIRTVHVDVQRCIVELHWLICPLAVSSAALNSMHSPRSLPGVAHTRRATNISQCGRPELIRDDDETHISSRHRYQDGLDVVSSLMQ